jgi:pimeloyl-ACP methyl ester carboxylesterase
MRQSARRLKDDTLIATAEFVFVTINREGRPIPVPAEVGAYMNARPARGASGEVRRVEPDPDDAALQRLTVNGVSLAVDVRGSGPAVLLVHGYPVDRTLWRAQLADLDGWRRIAPDLRGLGRSDAPDLGYSMATYAEDLAALLDALGEEDVVMVGLSMGGYVAFEFLRRYRARVRALVLMGTRAEPDSPEGKRARDAAAALARDGGARAVADQMLPRVLSAGAQEEVVAEVRRMMEAAPVPGIVGALGAMRDRPDSTALLPGLGGLPTLVVVGEDDAFTPPVAARAMADAIPGAQFAVLPGAGHFPPIERPAETTRVLREFLAALPAR